MGKNTTSKKSTAKIIHITATANKVYVFYDDGEVRSLDEKKNNLGWQTELPLPGTPAERRFAEMNQRLNPPTSAQANTPEEILESCFNTSQGKK